MRELRHRSTGYVHDADLEGRHHRDLVRLILRANRMRVPSENDAGPRFSILSVVSCCAGAVPSGVTHEISADVCEVEGSLTVAVKMIFRPSGDQLGLSSTVATRSMVRFRVRRRSPASHRRSP